MVTVLCLAWGLACALVVHAVAWEVRRTVLWLLALGGLLGYGTAWKLTVLMIEIGDDSGGMYSPAIIGQANQNFRLALLGAVLLGLYHSFLLEKRWAWWKWVGTILAVFGEAGAAFVVYCLSCELLPTAYRPLFYDVFWFMLGGLSVLRPLVARGIYALKEDTIACEESATGRPRPLS